MHWQFRVARLAFAAPQSLRSALIAAGITVKPKLPLNSLPMNRR